MSLWNKLVKAIGFQDVDDFLQTKQPEGLQLDYKSEIPNDLAKIVAAFANTTGGIIILGVQDDSKTTQPIWPPPAGSRGMPDTREVEAQIIQTCRDNIQPPIFPLVSNRIENQHLAGMVIYVVRVDASREAPHATDGGRRIYERTVNVSKPIDFASLDRIEHLLNRRRVLESHREELITEDVRRGFRQMAQARKNWAHQAGIAEVAPDWLPRDLPVRWFSLTPYYPWRDICEPDQCGAPLQILEGDGRIQRIPKGAFTIKYRSLGNSSYPAYCGSVCSLGNVFVGELVRETVADQLRKINPTIRPEGDYWVGFTYSRSFAEKAMELAKSFLANPKVEKPGNLQVTFGIQDAFGMRMNYADGTGQKFVNQHFTTALAVTAHEFLETPAEITKSLLRSLAFGFDLDADKIQL